MLFEEKRENEYLSKGILWLMTIATGLVVANNYYNQPLLAMIARDLNVSEGAVSRVPMFTQIGYAAGLLLVIPLGDMVRRKKLILIDFCFILTSLLIFAFSKSLTLTLFASFAIGMTSVIPQVFIPMAAQLSNPKDKNKNVAQIMTGLLIGILASRVFSGLLGEYLGWREVFLVAAGIMIILAILIFRLLPNVKPTFNGTYAQLLSSIFYYAKTLPSLRLASVRGALGFGAFSVFWTVLAFRLEVAPYFQGSDVAGLLGIFGIAGAMGTSIGSKLSGKLGANRVITVSCSLLIASWVVFGLFDSSYIGLIAGILLVDLGLAWLNVTNQFIVFSSNPEASSRLNTVYMSSYFVGGAMGTLLSGIAWEHYGWTGVVALGSSLATLCLIIHLVMRKRVKLPGEG